MQSLGCSKSAIANGVRSRTRICSLVRLIGPSKCDQHAAAEIISVLADAVRQLSDYEHPHLQTLGTRDVTDPTIALVDAWSVVADVLTFYRDRLTQEAYLRTASEERSLRELAGMAGYSPRPGVRATTHLAYQLDPSAKPVTIDAGSKAQTVPRPGETMQTFETDKPLDARAEWSQLKPRLDRPAKINFYDALTRTTLRIADASQVVRPGERVLFVFNKRLGGQIVREVASAKPNIEKRFVELRLKPREGFSSELDDTERKVLAEIRENLKALQIEQDAAIASETHEPSSKDRERRSLMEYVASFFLGSRRQTWQGCCRIGQLATSKIAATGWSRNSSNSLKHSIVNRAR